METDRAFRSGWRVGETRKLGPKLYAEGIYEGPLDSPYIVSEPSRLRAAIRAETLRGRHPFRTAPRDLKIRPGTPDHANIDKAFRKQSVVGSSPGYAHGLGSFDGLLFGMTADDVKRIREKVLQTSSEMRAVIRPLNAATQPVKDLKSTYDRLETRITNFDKQYFAIWRSGADLGTFSRLRMNANAESWYSTWASFDNELKALANQYRSVMGQSAPSIATKTASETDAGAHDMGSLSAVGKYALIAGGVLLVGAVLMRRLK